MGNTSALTSRGTPAEGERRRIAARTRCLRGFRQRAWRIVDSTICAVTTRPDTFASSGMLSRKVCITVELGSDAIGSGHLAVTV